MPPPPQSHTGTAQAGRSSRNAITRFFCLFSGREHAWGELRSAELSTSLQISGFLFLCDLSSPWATSQNDRWSWANWEGVSRTLSKAELCNNGPYLDARTDRISPHTSLLPSHTLPHPQKDPLSRISTSKKLAVPWSIFHDMPTGCWE